MNQGEIDVIRKKVLPTLSCKAEHIGIIAPYNAQVDALQRQIEALIDIATIHKFQGREKIIMSIVDNQIPTSLTTLICRTSPYRGPNKSSV